MICRMYAVGSRPLGSAALTGLLALAIALAPAAAEEAADPEGRTVRPSQVQLEGIALGIPSAELGWTLEGKGFRPSQKGRRRYVDDTGDVKKRIRYRDLPNVKGVPVIWELDLTTWHPSEGFDEEAVRKEITQRWGEPQQTEERNVGHTRLVYIENPDAPTLADVATACQAEIRKADPDLPEAEAEAKAYGASSYAPGNDQVEKLCPGATPLYRSFAEALEAPRMTIDIRSGRVDTSLRWPRLEADLVRKLGRDKATRIVAGLDPFPEEIEKGASD
jgi:hypothetical protein